MDVKSWTVKKAECWKIDAFELWCWRRLLRVPWDWKEIQPVHSKGDQSCIFIGRTDAETPVLWPSHETNWLIGRDSDTERDWRQEEKGMTEDDMAGWHHWLDGHEFEWTPGVGDGQGSLVYCDSWGRKESDTTKRLNWTELMLYWSLQLHTLLPSPVIFTAGCCFCFGSILSFFSGVVSPLISSSILGTWWPGGVPLSVSYLFAFSYCSWGSQGKNIEVVCHSLLHRTTFC